MPVPPGKRLISRKGFASTLRGALRYLFGKEGHRLVNGMRLFYRLRLLIMMGTNEPIGKLTRGNEVRIWVDGNESFTRLEQLLRRAKHSIVIQMFIWKDDEAGRHIANVLIEAADRGVHVDITKEAVGDFFEYFGDFLGTQTSDDPVWKVFWSHPRIRINYVTNRDHAKVYVIDDQILLLTGMNIANEYRYQWHDYMVELRGAEYVTQFLTRGKWLNKGKSIELVMNTEESKDIRSALNILLDDAQESVIVEHCYMSDPDVTDRLVALTRRDVRVTVIIPDEIDFHYHANMRTVGRLLAEGDKSNLNILLYPKIFHAKIVLVDHRFALIGSMNLMKSSLDDMGEVNVLIRDKQRAIGKLYETLRTDILACRSISSPPSLLWFSRWLAWLGL
ncbi:MAG TPA: phosphatidylserine/phosphatidylglycerophosphate/cardiolipin synthase family protein [Candidatus Peribacteraceae bacterium]|nr:phosphatidylserine/phosphatidylglycerophosphate/cardiolipin synthase family protein [Candidatus Peribacteraceae bacterium]